MIGTPTHPLVAGGPDWGEPCSQRHAGLDLPPDGRRDRLRGALTWPGCGLLTSPCSTGPRIRHGLFTGQGARPSPRGNHLRPTSNVRGRLQRRSPANAPSPEKTGTTGRRPHLAQRRPVTGPSQVHPPPAMGGRWPPGHAGTAARRRPLPWFQRHGPAWFRALARRLRPGPDHRPRGPAWSPPPRRGGRGALGRRHRGQRWRRKWEGRAPAANGLRARSRPLHSAPQVLRGRHRVHAPSRPRPEPRLCAASFSRRRRQALLRTPGP